MKFFATIKTAEGLDLGPPPASLMGAIAAMSEEAVRNGTLLETGGHFRAALIQLSKGTVSVTDGPYAEAKEIVGGYAIYSLDSVVEAVEVSRRFLEVHKEHWPGWEGDVEVRQLMDYSEGEGDPQ